MSISLHRTAPLGVALALAAFAAPSAAAERLTFDDARSEVRATAKMSVRTGDASGFSIVRCRRITPRQIRCLVRFRDVRRAGRTCDVRFTVTLRDENYATRPSIPVCRG